MSNWIRCSEKSPERGQVVIVFTSKMEMGSATYIPGLGYLRGAYLRGQPTHWQAIEPPKEGE